MLPRFAINNAANLTEANAGLVCKKLLRYIAMFVSPSYFHNSSVSKLGNWRSFAPHVAILVYLVLVVVALRAEEKMARVAARRVIASVKHVVAFWDVSKMKLPGDAVREENKFAAVVVPFNPPVARAVRLAFPAPASIRFFDHTPKAFSDGARDTCNSLAERSFAGDDCDRFDVVSHIVLARAAPYRGSAFALSGYQFGNRSQGIT